MQLLKELEGLHISGVIMEATSRYHSLAESMLISAGLSVAVINPRLIKNLARAMGKVAKNDSIDARIICEYGRRMKPEFRPGRDKKLQDLAQLLTRRRQLVQNRVMEANRLQEKSCYHGLHQKVYNDTECYVQRPKRLGIELKR